MRGGPLAAALAAAALAAGATPAGASDWVLTGSGRIDALSYRNPTPFLRAQGVSGGAVNLDGWFDTRAYYRDWEASARFRVHQSSGIAGDASEETIDRRHVAFHSSDLEVWAGNYYVTFGNGLILRTLEERFVTLNRTERAFNLDRNLDGVRVRSSQGPAALTLVSGRPNRQSLSTVGGASAETTQDLLQGGEATASAGPFTGGFGYVRAELEDAGAAVPTRNQEDLVSYRGRAAAGGWSGEFEYAEKRPHGEFDSRGFARYLRVDGAVGPVGMSLEAKSYRRFSFPYNQPPTLVRTQESVLLNRATHVLLPEDERGVQAEILVAPSLDTSVLLNLSGSGDHHDSYGRQYREVYLEGRGERDGVGAARLGLDWGRDRLEGVDDRWTAALELERFVTGAQSLIVDLEMQAVDEFRARHTHGLMSLAWSKAGAWTASVTGEHDSERDLDRRDWLFGSLDLRLSERHDLTVGYGSRPEGTVCTGGFCFVSPAFEGAEVRLLSRF